MKSIFLLLTIAFLSSISFSSVNAEETYRGNDYQDIDYGNGTHVWTGGLPEWLHDYTTSEGKKVYVPYKIHETDDHLTYESASITFTLSKTFCDIKLYDKGKVVEGEEPLITSLSHVVKEAKNGTDVWADSTINSDDCDMEIQTNPDGIKAIVTKSNTNGTFKTIYDTSLTKRDLEWTWEYENLNQVDKKFGFTSTCQGKLCDSMQLGNNPIESGSEISKDELGGKKIKFSGNEDLYFDPDPDKKKPHDYLHVIKTENDKAIMDFTDAKNSLPKGNKLIIDPTFAYTAGTRWAVDSASSISVSCSTTGSLKFDTDTSNEIIMGISTNNEFCRFFTPEWNTSSIPDDATATNVNIRYDVNGDSNGRNCDWKEINNQPSAAGTTATILLADAQDGTVFVDNNAGCTAAATDLVLDMGTNADTDLTALLPSGWWAVGITPDSLVRDATAHDIDFGVIELEVTYITVPGAPTGLAVATASATRLNLSWTAPADNGGSAITGYKIERQIHTSACTGGSMSTLVADTGTTTTTYSDTTATPDTCHSYQISAINAVGTGSASTPASGYTTRRANGSVSVDGDVVGDVVRLNGTVTLTQGNTTHNTVTTLRFYKNGTLFETESVSQNMANNTSTTFSSNIAWNQMTDNNHYNYTITATVTNNAGIRTLNSTGSIEQREYDPDYFDAVVVSQGTVNYTINRESPYDELNLKVNRDKAGATFQIECLYQNSTEATLETGGTWNNRTVVGWYNHTLDVSALSHYYISCYNDDLLFTTTSYTNSTLGLLGIAVMDITYGSYLGVPVGVLFVVMSASLASNRNAPIWIVIVLAIAGMMATIGFFTLDQNVWALALIAGLLGLFVGRKLF